MASGTPTPCTWAPGDFRIIKHIPKSARGACALHLASILRSVVSDAASASNWQGLFHCFILQPAKRGGKRHNLASTVKKRISSFSVGVTPAQSTDNSHNRRTTTNNTLSQAIAANLEDGNVRAAIHLLISDDTVAAPSVEPLSKLKESILFPLCRPQYSLHLNRVVVFQLRNPRFAARCRHSQQVQLEALTAYVPSTSATCCSVARAYQNSSVH